MNTCNIYCYFTRYCSRGWHEYHIIEWLDPNKAAAHRTFVTPSAEFVGWPETCRQSKRRILNRRSSSNPLGHTGVASYHKEPFFFSRVKPPTRGRSVHRNKSFFAVYAVPTYIFVCSAVYRGINSVISGAEWVALYTHTHTHTHTQIRIRKCYSNVTYTLWV